MQPVINLLRDHLLASALVHGDETVAQVLKEKGKAAQSKSYMWAQMTQASGADGTGPPIRLFAYSPSRSTQAAQLLYAGMRVGSALMTDGYQPYNAIAATHRLVHLFRRCAGSKVCLYWRKSMRSWWPICTLSCEAVCWARRCITCRHSEASSVCTLKTAITPLMTTLAKIQFAHLWSAEKPGCSVTRRLGPTPAPICFFFWRLAKPMASMPIGTFAHF